MATEDLVFPSQEWFDAYETEINDDSEYREKSEGWGVGFNGDFVFEMTDMPVPNIDVDAMPPDLQAQFDRYITETDTGYTGYAYLGLEDGTCTGAELVEDPDSVDNGFLLSAETAQWEQLLDGNIDVIQGLMGGHFDLDGDMQKILQYSDAAQQLTSIASSIDAAFATERFADT